MALANITTANAAGASSTTITVTSASGNNRLAVLVATQEVNPVNVTSALLDGVAGTLAVTATSSTERSALFYWLDADLPATGGSYAVSHNGTGSVNAISVLVADGLDQSAPSDTGSIITNTVNGVADVITLSSAGAGALLAGGMVRNAGGGSIALGAGQSAILPDTAQSGTARFISSYNSDDNTHSYTTSGSNNQVQAIVAASFDLSVATGPTITDVNTDEIVTDGETGVVITGTGFSETPGNNTVTIDGVEQTITAESATSITITHVLGVMKFGDQTLTVTVV